MSDRPLIVFPRASDTAVEKRTNFQPPTYKLPTHERQVERLTRQFDLLVSAFQQHKAEFRRDVSGVLPEQVVVIETVGTVEEFINAVKATGMEWMGEWDEEEIYDDDFEREDTQTDRPVSGKLFLAMSRERHLNDLIKMWREWSIDRTRELPHGMAKWRAVLDQLRTIRFWDVQDRLSHTGFLERLRDAVELEQLTIRFEAELWYRELNANLVAGDNYLRQVIVQNGGNILREYTIPDIAYHGVLVEMPVQNIQSILEQEDLDRIDLELFKCAQVMFFRPTGQSIIPVSAEETTEFSAKEDLPSPEKSDPIVALLDGLPLQNHILLQDRLIVDDPDGWGEEYEAAHRVHGSAMASLILHNELDAEDVPLQRPLYVRPLMKSRSGWDGRFVEQIPEDELVVDLVHKAFVRIFGSSTVTGVAPTVKVINLSIGDENQQFTQFMSAWARLIDWLAWNYKVLILVSAGNQNGNISLDIPKGTIASLPEGERQSAVLHAVNNMAHSRRLLSPAESVNALTVGASHSDFSTIVGASTDRYCLYSDSMPSPYNSLGLGHRRAIKPDVLMAGGRIHYREPIVQPGENTILEVISSPTRPPGQKAATPGRSGDITAVRFFRGTSNATALTSRTAAQLYETLELLRNEPGGEVLQEKYTAVLLKALIVHGVQGHESYQVLHRAFESIVGRYKIKEHISRYLGYGEVNPSRVFNSTDQRATLLGCDELSNGEAHLYRVHLPSCFNQKLWRRLTVTLAWLSPVEPRNRRYRCAALSFQPDNAKTIGVSRRESADHHACRRGTVQHEVFEGNNATPFITGDTLNIRVSCRIDGKTYAEERIPYAIAVSLEIAENQEIAIFEEIYAAMRVAVPVQSQS